VTPESLLEQWEGVELPTLLHALRWGVNYEDIAYRLQHDGQFAIEMRLCKEWRIPHSEFLSWDEEDQAKALGHFVYEAQRCGQCGIHPTDWPDPDEPVFEAAVKVCPGCAEMDRFGRWMKEKAEDEKANDALDGVKPYLKKVGE
jgi:hypothetical protein